VITPVKSIGSAKTKYLTSICLLLAGAAFASDKPVSFDPGQFASPAMQFRPRPLWFWNNTTVEKTAVREQMRMARDRSGYGGFGILPFGRKFSPAYLSDDYFAVYGTALDEAKSLGMTMSLYDEFGFPSGSAGSKNSSDTSMFAKRWPELIIKRLDNHEWEITGPGPFEAKMPDGQLAALVAMNTKTFGHQELSQQVKQGRIAWTVPEGPWKIMAFVCVIDGETICDYLDPDAADRFIELTHQAYYDRFSSHFGTTIDSSFFDEPTLYRAKGRTWTDKFNEKFQARHGFDPRPYYPALWHDIGPDTQAARNYLFGFRTELYATGFTKRIQDWCAAHGIAATGHQDQEEVVNPVSVSGDLMKCFQHLEIPGIDKIGGDRPAEKFYKVVSSAAYNWDRALVMSETYGAMGDLSWDAIHSVAMEQYTKGINVLIPHAVWYDNSKVTYKPELSWRHPAYAEGLPAFNTWLSRLNVMLQNNAAHVADIAVLYPIATLQGSHYLDGPLGHYKGGVAVPEADYVELGELLAVQIGRDYTFLHPEVLAGRCKVDGSSLVLPNRIHPGRFSVMILPGHETIHWSALKQIQNFFDQGGSVIATGKLPSKSAEFGKDREVADAIEAMFGKTGSAPEGGAISVRRNDRGGHAIRLHELTAGSLLQALDTTQTIPDVSFAPGTALRYIHKTANRRHVFYFANLDPRLSGSTVTLRGHHQLEAWDPHTGNIRPIPVNHVMRDGDDITTLRLELPHLKSVFLVTNQAFKE
jgi:alpha-L-rhamnosidase